MMAARAKNKKNNKQTNKQKLLNDICSLDNGQILK